MGHKLPYCVLLTIVLTELCEICTSHGLGTSFSENESKIDLRKELDKITQELLMKKDPFYHSYVFNSGVGNREKLEVEWMKQSFQFAAGNAVVGWQAVRNMDRIHLLGRKQSSVTLVTSGAQLSSSGSAQFHEHSINFEVNVTSTSLFTRWNPTTAEPEVVVVVAVDTSAAHVLFYRVINGKLEYITRWFHYKKVSCLTAVSIDGKNQLIIADKGSPATIHVVDVLFTSNHVTLDFRLVQSFTVDGECKSATVCRTGEQHYLVLPLAEHLVVFRLVSGHYQKHRELSVPRVSQVVCFSVALQTYLAINGEVAHVVRLTERGEFISELMLGHVSEWLVLPVSSYRSDVLLLSRAANLTKAYVWAGANKGFDAVTVPNCDSCLDGDWLGAISVPFQHQNCLLIPQPQRVSRLVTVGTSLHNSNPVLDKLNTTITVMKQYQDEWHKIKSKMAELEDMLKHTVKTDGKNVITGKWKINRLESPKLTLSSIVKPRTDTSIVEGSSTGEETEKVKGEEGPVQLEALESTVEAVIAKGKELVRDVERKERQVWGLEGFRGRVTFKGKLIVDNLTIYHLNREPMDQLLQNTFRRDKPKPIQRTVVMESLEAEEIVFNRINNRTSEDLKFSDGPLVIRGDMTFERSLTVRGEVEFEIEGGVNGVDLARELCPGEHLCSVFPMVDSREEEVSYSLNNSIDKKPDGSFKDHFWSRTIAGRNLTVIKINGVDWMPLTQNVVYKDAYQKIIGSVIVKGKVTSERGVYANSIQYVHHPQSRLSDSSKSLEDLDAEGSSVSVDRKILDNLPMASELILSELEVTGTVTCTESEWGAEAADVVLRDANPIVINGDKTFTGAVNVTNNAEVEGTLDGVDVSELLTRDTDQTFYGPTTLHGNVTLQNVILSGLWNGKNVSNILEDRSNPYKDMSGVDITADTVRVLETINGIPVSDLVFKEDNGVINLKSVKVARFDVTGDIFVDGKVCEVDLDDFNERRLSLKKEQNITGSVSIKSAKVTTGFQPKKLNDIEISSFIDDPDDTESFQMLHLSELHVYGDIVTNEGVNSFNLSDVADSVVWLESNNNIEGPLTFEDEVEFDLLQCQGFCNGQPCDTWLNADDVVYRDNKSITLSGKKRFTNILNISEELTVQEINGHNVEDILTTKTEQEIVGDVIVDGDVRIAEDSTVLGLLNSQNLTVFGHRCALEVNTIICKGNAVFKDSVRMEHFVSPGKMNQVEFDAFLESVVRTDEPQWITGFTKFIGNTVKVESLEDLDRINGESWNGFLASSINTGGVESIAESVTFSGPLSVRELSVDLDLDADSVDGVNLTEWKTDAIYINVSHSVTREMHLKSASSRGNLSVDQYDGLDLDNDVVKLRSPSYLPELRVESVTVVEEAEVTGDVNGQDLAALESNTLKTSGDQLVTAEFAVLGETVINGSLSTEAQVNNRDLRDVVTLATDQTLHGKYEFDHIEARENVSTSELISGINLTSWTQTGVMKDGRDEVISGVWRVRGTLEVKGPVTGEGRLADVDLRQLTDNITREVLGVHSQMKRNLTKACEEVNALIASARSQTCQLQYLDVMQTLLVPSGPSLVTHFKDSDEDFLAVSEHSCITTIYKWNKNTGTFSSLHREKFGFSLKNFIILYYKQLTYVVTESSEPHPECEHNGKHLWIFMKDHFKHVSDVNFFEGDLFQGEENTFYNIKPTGMFKYTLDRDIIEERAFFKSEPHQWDIAKDAPKEWFGVSRYDWLPDVYTASNCTGKVVSVSVDPHRQFVAVASTEAAQVPRHADYIKVYRQDGRLFDKLPAASLAHLQWLSVPAQTWLLVLQNHTTLSLYQLQGPLLGFQLHTSVYTDATDITTVALPLTSKVNPQPFIILKSHSSVTILRAFLQGDPYLGANLNCSFDQVLTRVPRN